MLIYIIRDSCYRAKWISVSISKSITVEYMEISPGHIIVYFLN
jgi:hypothetical protein